MKPVEFTCTAIIPEPAEAIAEQILQVERWPEFTGYGVIPGIQQAEFESRTPEVVGSRVRVTNTDGSRHVETIVEWQPGVGLRLHMTDFSPPLARLATDFDEIWSFEPVGKATRVTRQFRLHPKSALTRPAVWAMSFLLKRAIARSLQQMRASALEPATSPADDAER
jgi:ribosome-associated toxin RatA of RatAB toxin-antitoxin module